MYKKVTDKLRAAGKRKQISIIAIVGLAVIVLVFVILYFYFTTPQRSVAAYCAVYKTEKARLATFPGNTYSSTVFNKNLSDAGEFATSFGRLDQVAPSDIEPDVATLRAIYQKIHDDPSQAITASLSGISAESSVKAWTVSHCINSL